MRGKKPLHLIVLLLAAFFSAPLPASALSAMDPFNVGATFDPGAVTAGQDIAYGDDPRQRLDVYTPEARDGLAPVVVFIYGGGWNRGDRADYAFVGNALAARGFVTIVADYRLVPDVTYPSFVEDCAAAVKWAETNAGQFGGDKSRLYLLGHSAGAYDVVMLGLDKSFLAQAGVTETIKGIAALSGPYDFYPFEYDEVRNAFGSADNPEATQPVNIAAPGAPPMLLGVGTADPIVQPQNSDQLALALKRAGDIVIENKYDGLTHMEPILVFSSLWRWRAPVLDDVVGFFSDLGAFADGKPRTAIFPQAAPPADDKMEQIVRQLDNLLGPATSEPLAPAPENDLQ